MLGISINWIDIDVLEDILHLIGSDCRGTAKSLAQLREDWCTRQRFETLDLNVGLSVVRLEEDVADDDYHNGNQHVNWTKGQTGKDTEHVANNGNVAENLNRQQLIDQVQLFGEAVNDSGARLLDLCETIFGLLTFREEWYQKSL